ncbi:ankyrin repeat and LEM domain-containing protein 2 homolog isoform X2 [Leptopilina boulardi]|uniref:ankyrin repeat and LEM domain-containing protein 2 homolog isoform X2 n=1 Tax=Leptopilina boulardi TaxID=63433 RepID=UPI0021F51749|nr:ankyrin repeat and LEM domain-containing protein 2 homolog isoform X2 [Leptopilina boulardi]
MSQSVITSFVDYFQQVLRLNSGMSENKENSPAYNLRSGESNLNSNNTIFYAVFIPGDNEKGDAKEEVRVFTEKSDALKLIKSHKNARLKFFKNRLDAENFSRNGGSTNDANVTTISTENVVGEEKYSNFKGPKPQDLVRFRKLIEAGDLDAVKSVIWENPRYLVSSGDTPAILHEGSRYNALHIATKSAHSGLMCELLLSTINNPNFVKLLYGEIDLLRAQILLDLYLNTPDKGLNETPLHFAVKFGQKEAVKVLVSYSQCVKNVLNKYRQKPLEIICARKNSDDEELKRQIRSLLEDQFYVPVLRSKDDTLQPTIGEPFSPTSPRECEVLQKYKIDPISPQMEVHAFAGPMSKTQAIEFRRKWKTPPRYQGTPTRLNFTPTKLHLTPTRENRLNDSFTDTREIIRTPIQNLSLRLQDPQKGLERVGRVLAEEYHVPWKEFWPFLDSFADLGCSDGLWKLEKFLEARFKGYFIPIENFESCNLHINEEDEENTEDDFYTPPSSPMSCNSSEDEKMELAEEGTTTFIECNAPTKTDYAVFNAVPSTVTPYDYPNIYRWKHEMQMIMRNNPTGNRSTPGIRRKLRL